PSSHLHFSTWGCSQSFHPSVHPIMRYGHARSHYDQLSCLRRCRAHRGRTLYLENEVLHHGSTGAGQIAKIEVCQDRGSARIVPFLRSPTRTVERASSPHRARTGDTEVYHEPSDLCRHGYLTRHG